MAFDSLETIGEARADLRAGLVASAAANNGYWTLEKPYKPLDFMPFQQVKEDENPILLASKDDQSALILRMVFNRE